MFWIKMLVVAMLATNLAAAAAVGQTDIYYFHDSSRDSIWSNTWNPGLADNCFGPSEFMDCCPPTAVQCAQWVIGTPRWVHCHLDLPGCATGIMPAGTWVVNLWLKQGPTYPGSVDVHVDLWTEVCNTLCLNTEWWGVQSTTAYLTQECEPVSLIYPGMPATSLINERFWAEICIWPDSGAIICWDGIDCPSNVQAPALVFCSQDPSATRRSSWGAIKSLYR